jgi:hypothetical protein
MKVCRLHCARMGNLSKKQTNQQTHILITCWHPGDHHMNIMLQSTNSSRASSLQTELVAIQQRGDVELFFFFFAAILCFLVPDIWIGNLPVHWCWPQCDANNRHSIKPPRLPSKYQSFCSIEYVACSVSVISFLAQCPVANSTPSPSVQP